MSETRVDFENELIRKYEILQAKFIREAGERDHYFRQAAEKNTRIGELEAEVNRLAQRVALLQSTIDRFREWVEARPAELRDIR